MTFSQAVERAMKDYYGNDSIATRVPILTKTKQKENKMNTQQLETMTKQELNRALTPFMGGYTSGNLANVKKDDLVSELQKHQKEAVTKPNKKKSSTRKDLLLKKDELLRSAGEKIKEIFGVDPNPALSKGKQVAWKFKTEEKRTMGILVRLDGTYTVYYKGQKFNADEISETLLNGDYT